MANKTNMTQVKITILVIFMVGVKNSSTQSYVSQTKLIRTTLPAPELGQLLYTQQLRYAESVYHLQGNVRDTNGTL